MAPRPPRSTRPDTRFPYAALFRSARDTGRRRVVGIDNPPSHDPPPPPARLSSGTPLPDGASASPADPAQAEPNEPPARPYHEPSPPHSSMRALALPRVRSGS